MSNVKKGENMLSANLFGTSYFNIDAHTKQEQFRNDAANYRVMRNSQNLSPSLFCRVVCAFGQFLLRSGRSLLDRFDPLGRLSGSHIPRPQRG